jgi:hypothetical protein
LNWHPSLELNPSCFLMNAIHFQTFFEVVKEVRILLPKNFTPSQKAIFENNLTRSIYEQSKAAICLPDGISLQP